MQWTPMMGRVLIVLLCGPVYAKHGWATAVFTLTLWWVLERIVDHVNNRVLERLERQREKAVTADDQDAIEVYQRDKDRQSLGFFLASAAAPVLVAAFSYGLFGVRAPFSGFVRTPSLDGLRRGRHIEPANPADVAWRKGYPDFRSALDRHGHVFTMDEPQDSGEPIHVAIDDRGTTGLFLTLVFPASSGTMNWEDGDQAGTSEAMGMVLIYVDRDGDGVPDGMHYFVDGEVNDDNITTMPFKQINDMEHDEEFWNMFMESSIAAATKRWAREP